MTTPLTVEEKQTLLQIARSSIESVVSGKSLPLLDRSAFTQSLNAKGASFVTLTIDGNLRGCIGALEAYQPLAEDVREHAISSAVDDPRFPSLRESDLARIRIEVSRLSEPRELIYSDGDDLLLKLHPHVDGVVLKQGLRKATFLPQVWETIPDPAEFLNQLCYKMGLPPNTWRETKLQVYVYQVEEFRELN